LNSLRAVNAYNGRLLWEYPLPDIHKAYNGEHLMGTSGTHSYYCIARDSLFVRNGNDVLRLDPDTGKKLAQLEASKSKEAFTVPWCYIATDNGQLFGS